MSDERPNASLNNAPEETAETSAGAVVVAPPAGWWGERETVLVLVLALFAAACALPAVDFRGAGILFSSGQWAGIAALVFGWKTVPWYANILCGIGFLYLAARRYFVAVLLGWGAVGVASSVWFAVYVGGCDRLIDNMAIEGLLVGAYVWLATFLVFTLAAMRLNWKERQRTRELNRLLSEASRSIETSLELPAPLTSAHIADRKEVDGTEAF